MKSLINSKFLRSLFIVHCSLIITILAASPVLSIDTTQSATTTLPDRKAQDLLNRVATKVATLTSKLRRVYTGKIKSVGTASYVVTTQDGDRSITTNDVTSFYRLRAGNRTEVNFNSLKVGDDLATIGTIDPATFEMTAKQIIAKVKRYNIVGTIAAINKTVYSIQEINGPLTKIDLSDAVNLKMANSKNQIVAGRLDSFKQGDTVFVIAYSTDASSDTLSVLKILRLFP